MIYNEACRECPASLACVAGVTDYYRNYRPHENVIVTVFNLELEIQFLVSESCPGFQNKIAQRDVGKRMEMKKEWRGGS